MPMVRTHDNVSNRPLLLYCIHVGQRVYTSIGLLLFYKSQIYFALLLIYTRVSQLIVSLALTFGFLFGC